MIRLDERQAVAIEHAADVHEEDAIDRAAEDNFLVEQFSQTAPVRRSARLGNGPALPCSSFRFCRCSGFRAPGCKSTQRSSRPARKSRRLPHTIQEELNETFLVHLLEFVHIRPAPAQNFAGAAVNDHAAMFIAKLGPPRSADFAFQERWGLSCRLEHPSSGESQALVLAVFGHF